MGEVYRVSVPGRVCLVGEHCDYAKGMSVAVPTHERITMYGERRDDNHVTITSGLEGKVYETSVWILEKNPVAALGDHPLKYSVAVLQKLLETTVIRGMDLTIRSDLPAKKGLASSASVSVATAQMFNQAYGLALAKDDLAEIAYRAEHDVLEIGCGRMDQLVAAYDTPVLLDFREGMPQVKGLPKPLNEFYFLIGIPMTTRRALHLMLEKANKAYFNPESERERLFGRALDELIPNLVVKPFLAALEDGQRTAAGQCLRENQAIYDQYFVPLDESFDAPILHQFLKIARDNESLGEKWTGAGGAGAFLCLAQTPEHRKELKKALEKKSPVDIHFVEVTL